MQIKHLVQDLLSSRRTTAYLSGRERQVLVLLTEGKTNKEIGKNLKISPFTVRSHVSRMLKSFDLSNRTQLVVLALRHENLLKYGASDIISKRPAA